MVVHLASQSTRYKGPCHGRTEFLPLSKAQFLPLSKAQLSANFKPEVASFESAVSLSSYSHRSLEAQPPQSRSCTPHISSSGPVGRHRELISTALGNLLTPFAFPLTPFAFFRRALRNNLLRPLPDQAPWRPPS
jgi:hypothetical protein